MTNLGVKAAEKFWSKTTFRFSSFFLLIIYANHSLFLNPHIMADIDAHLVEADPQSDSLRVFKDIFAGTCGGIGTYFPKFLMF